MGETFSPQALLERKACWAGSRRLLVACSGGLDSSVLLHALHALRDEIDAVIEAVHVHHGLHSQADDWLSHCRTQCKDLQISLHDCHINASPAPGESPEAAARKARYAAIATMMDARTCLLTAQHRDDQAETLLLQLMRGAGPRGLAAMPVRTRFAGGWHARPLLDFGREALRDWAVAQGLSWVEDPTNQDKRFDRNFVRHHVLPRLRERWPGAGATLARAAGHQAGCQRLLDELAAQDLEVMADQRLRLDIGALKALSRDRQRNLLRYWLDRQGFRPPGQARLDALIDGFCHSGGDATPRVVWDDVEVRRHQGRLYAMALLSPPPEGRYDWDPGNIPVIDVPGWRLRAEPVIGAGVSAARGSLQVGFRQGGERCRPAPGAPTRELKKLLQEAGVPAWERERMPLIFSHGKLAAVPGYWVCEDCRAGAGEPGFVIRAAPTEPDHD